MPSNRRESLGQDRANSGAGWAKSSGAQEKFPSKYLKYIYFYISFKKIASLVKKPLAGPGGYS